MTNPSEIEREIEEARDRLANTIDQLVYRSSPKTVVGREVAAVKAHYVDAQGQPRTDNILKTVGGVVGVIAVFVVIRKLVR
ncbi:MAG TPA: DUF3618 domain-containing protein [Nocardioides sp.]|nr:DUF3618 domain-containing protein [Nocardioides sp.]